MGSSILLYDDYSNTFCEHVDGDKEELRFMTPRHYHVLGEILHTDYFSDVIKIRVVCHAKTGKSILYKKIDKMGYKLRALLEDNSLEKEEIYILYHDTIFFQFKIREGKYEVRRMLYGNTEEIDDVTKMVSIVMDSITNVSTIPKEKGEVVNVSSID